MRTLAVLGQTRFAQGQPSSFKAGEQSVMAECAQALASIKDGEAAVERPGYCYNKYVDFCDR
jgi:hypothetical protein